MDRLVKAGKPAFSKIERAKEIFPSSVCHWLHKSLGKKGRQWIVKNCVVCMQACTQMGGWMDRGIEGWIGIDGQP